MTVSQAELVADTFHHVVLQLTSFNDIRLGQLDLLSEKNGNQIVERNLDIPRSVATCIDADIFKYALEHPDTSAVCAWDGNFTYAELVRISTNLSQHLSLHGVGPEVFVPICCDRSRWVVAAVLAVLKAGGAFILLDSSHPAERLQDMLRQDFSCPVMISSPAHVALAGRVASTVVIVEDQEQEWVNKPPSDPIQALSASPSNAAYAVFSSGSTGKPKASIIEHKSFRSAVDAHRQALCLDEHARVLQFASYAFDASIIEVLTTLLVGGCVCIPSDADRQGRLGAVMNEFQVNWALLTPSVARILDPPQIPSLKTLVLGGEGMSNDDVRRWSPYVHLMNAYGPSECSVISTVQPSSQALAIDSADIGRPTGGVNWVVNSQDSSQLVPLGAVGELLIEGPVVGRGYSNRPEQTAAAFLPYPVWLRAIRGFQKGFLYKTGDLVRHLSNGSFRYIGRKDSQVKLHGQRIELAEVEYHVQQCFPANNAVVFADMVAPEDPRNPYLVTSIVLASEVDYDSFDAAVAKARARLQAEVPAFLIPTAFIPLRQIPRLANGKVDRRQLRQDASQAVVLQMTKSERNTNGHPVKALTVEEQKLRLLWSRVLNRPAESIDPEDNFFRLGGDSIAVMKLASIASSEDLELAVSDVFSNPVLRELALVASSSNQNKPLSPTAILEKGDTVHPVPPFSLLPAEQMSEAQTQAMLQCDIAMDHIEDIYPSTPLQAGLAAITAERPGAYIAHHRLRLPQDVDIRRLKEAWQKVSISHPILRTRLIETPDLGCLQVVIKDEKLRWIDNGNREQQTIREMIFGHPLVQLAISPACSDNCNVTEIDLILTMHHATYDAWSLPRLLRDVQLAYRASGESCSETAPFQKFIQYINSKSEEALDFWHAEFENLAAEPFPPLPSPSYRPRALKEVQSTVLTEPSTSHSVTRSTSIQLAWAIVQSQYQSSDEVVFGMVSSGRTSPIRGTEMMTGPTIATIPLRIVIDPNVTVAQALEDLQSRTVQMVAFEQAGLHAIAALSPEATRACSFQTLLNVEGREEVENMVADLEVLQPLDTTFENGAFNTYAIQFTCRLKKGQVTIEASFDEHVVQEWQMQRILDQFCHILLQVHKQPQCLIRDVATINTRDIQALQNWNSEIPSLVQSTVLETIEQQCAAQPSAMAVNAWDGDFTYRELDTFSRDLARCLIAQNVGPETFVPIYIERSRWTIVAALAVLKAGAAFVLLETAYPPARLRIICEEVKAPVILSSVGLASKAETLGPKVITVGQRTENGSAWVTNIERSGSNAHRALYAVFTSGSTGKPKGAVVENGSFVTMAGPWARVMGLNQSSRVLHFASYAFDVSVLEILGTLFVGGCICVLSDHERREQLAPAVTKLQPSHALLTPSLLRVLNPSDLSSVQKLMLIGEPVRASDLREWRDHLHLLNTYGPAECTVVYTMQPSMSSASPANIGHSIAGAAWVTDPRDPHRLLPVGAVGELLLQGPLVGRGYLNSSEQTAAAFIPCPPWAQQLCPARDDQEEDILNRMYRTGDLVRYEADGSLCFVGRRDFQVKLRGQRFELGEVEAHIQQHFPGGLQDVAAEIVNPAAATKSSILVAFIAPRKTDTGSVLPSPVPMPLDIATPTDFAERVAAVKRRLEDVIPEFMVPVAFVALNQMPRTIGGKIDRKQLRSAAATVTRQQLESFAPLSQEKRGMSTDAERALQSIWARVLGIPTGKIGSEDSFFRLGGDSLTALQATQQARAIGIDHSVGDLFKWRTIQRIVKQFAPSARPAQASDDNVEGIYPCTPAQRGMLLSQMRDISSYAPHFIWRVDSDTSVNIDRLADAWRHVVAQQPALRAAFRPDQSVDSQFEQVLFRKVEPPLVILRGVADADDGSGVPAVLTRSIMTTVTRHDGYAVPHQLTICTNQAGQVFCRLDINHTIIDATSISVLERDLCQSYDQASQNKQPNSAYQKYIAFVQEQPQESAREYWKSYLEGTQPFSLPNAWTTANRSNDSADALQLEEFTLAKGGSDIVSFCRGTDWTPSNLLYFAWALTLGAFTGADDVCFGTLTSGRLIPVPGIDEAVGQFSNMAVCRVRMASELTLDEAAMRLQEGYAHVLSYQEFPLVEIARVAGMSVQELASTAVNVQYASQAGLLEASQKSSIQVSEVRSLDPVLVSTKYYVFQCFVRSVY